MVQEQTEEIVDNWNHDIPVQNGDAFYKLLKVVASENKRIDIDIESLYKNRFIGTATGEELEKIGDLVGIVRKNNEEDEKLRTRIRGGFAAKASDTTYKSFTSLALSILEANAEEVDFVTPPQSNPKTVEVKADGSVLDRTILTENELIILLNGALSVDAKAKIKNTGTFAFEGDDTSLKGFDEGTWSVGLN
jgi:hypothetical protein